MHTPGESEITLQVA